MRTLTAPADFWEGQYRADIEGSSDRDLYVDGARSPADSGAELQI